jgi:hypothetical protein
MKWKAEKEKEKENTEAEGTTLAIKPALLGSF